MKSYLILFSAFAMMSLFSTGCRTANCENLLLDALEKVEYFDATSCDAYKEAQQTYINQCLSGDVKTAAQTALDAINCSVSQ